MTKSTVKDDRVVYFVGNLTCFGRVRTLGEKLTVTPVMYEETLDPVTRSSWLDLTPGDQVQRWGEQMFTTDADHPALVKCRLSEELRQSPTRPRSTSDDPCVHALHREWEHEDRLRAQGGRVEIRSRTVAGPKP